MCSKFLIIYFLICFKFSYSHETLKHHKQRYNDNDYHSITMIYRNYMESMLNIVDWNVKPCDNFFQHACGYFETITCAKATKADTTNHKVPSKSPLLSTDSDGRSRIQNCQVPPYLYNHQDRFQFFLQAKDSFHTKHGRLLRNLYNLCTRLNHNASTVYKFHMLMYQIPFFHKDRQCLSHKWPFIPNEGHKCIRKLIRKWLRTAAELAAHGLQTFVAVFFSNHTIYITANHQLHCWSPNELSAYISKLLKPPNAPYIHLIANELWTFCQQLKNTTIDLPDNAEYVSQKCHLTNATQQVNNFLEENLWLDYMRHYLQRLEFSEIEISNAHKIISDDKQLSQVADLLKCSHPRIIYNFLIWQMLRELDINDCYNLLVENFERSLLIEYWSWNVFQAYFQRDRILTSYIFYITRFRQQQQLYQKINQWHYLFGRNRSPPGLQHNDLQLIEALQSYAEEHLANVKFLYNYPGNDTNAKDMEFRDDALIHSKKFYSLLLNLKRYQIRSTFFQISNNANDNIKDVIEADDENLFYYSLVKEFICFTILLINRPLLHFYATQNREMWSHSEILYTTDGLYTSIDCLIQQSHIQTESTGLFKRLLEQEMLEIYKFYKGFVASKRDYEFWLDGEVFAISEEFILEYFQMNTNQIMFYAVVQQYCGRNDHHFSYLINRSYMNYPDFDSLFNCTALNDAMIPQHKCSLDL